MSKPNITIPTFFGGVKADFDNNHLTNGFPQLTPDVLPGDCLNKFIDDTYKGLNGVLELYEGCVLYDSTVTYTNKSLIFNITNDEIKFYHSLQNGNINHALTDTDYWEEVNLGGSSRNIGEIVTSTIPLTDAGLHLLDGALINGSGIYADFVTYIAGLVSTYPDLFETESNWQAAVTTYGVCGKFVYDSVNNTVRLPKYSNKIYTGGGTAPVVGNGLGIGFTDGTHEFSPHATSSNLAFVGTSAIGKPVGDTTSGTGPTANKIFGVTSDTTKSGLIAQLSNITTSLDGYYYIVVATSTKTSIQVDIDEIATDLNGKADVDLSNINASQSAKETITTWGIPDYTNRISISSYNSLSNQYNCPSNGIIIGQIGGSSANVRSAICVNGTEINDANVSTAYRVPFLLIVSKDDKFYYSSSNTSYIYFIPMKGAS